MSNVLKIIKVIWAHRMSSWSENVKSEDKKYSCIGWNKNHENNFIEFETGEFISDVNWWIDAFTENAVQACLYQRPHCLMAYVSRATPWNVQTIVFEWADRSGADQGTSTSATMVDKECMH